MLTFPSFYWLGSFGRSMSDHRPATKRTRGNLPVNYRASDNTCAKYLQKPHNWSEWASWEWLEAAQWERSDLVKKGEEGDHLVARECHGCWGVWEGEIITMRFAFRVTRGWWGEERKHRHSSIPSSVHLRGLEMWSYGQNAAESRSAVAVGPQPSILTSITQALLPGTVDRLFLGRAYFQSDILEWIRPRRALMWCVWFSCEGAC